MTAVQLDDQRPGAPKGVTAPAWRILAVTGGVSLLVLVAGIGCLGVATYNVSRGHYFDIGNFWLVVGLTLVWSLCSVLRAALPPPAGVSVDRQDAPGLMELLSVAAADVGVPTPGQVLLGIDCSAELVQGEQGTVLVVGAPLVWGLRADDLRRVLIPVLAAKPERELRIVRWADAIAVRLHSVPLGTSLPGALLRAARPTTGRARAELEARIRAAAAVRTAVTGADELDTETLERLLEGWDHVVRGFVAPAWSRGLRPTHVLSALADVLSGSEQVWWTGGRGPTELEVGLLHDSERLDAQLSGLLAERMWGGRPGKPMAWPDHLDRVVGPARRERAARLLAAVDVVLGRPGPATPARVLDALDSDAAVTIAAELQRAAGAPAAGAEAHLETSLRCLVSCAIETSGRARSAISWRTGPVLVDADGLVLPHLQEQCWDAARGQTTALRTAMAELDIPTDGPVWVAGDEPADVGPQPVAVVTDVWHRGRIYDLVVCEDRLALVVTAGRGLDLRGAVEHYAGDDVRTADRLRRLLEGDVEAAVASSRHNAQVKTADIADVSIRAVLGQMMWRATLRTVDGERLVLRNGRAPKNVFVLRELLAPVLGDRLRVRGVDPRFPRLARVTPIWALLCVGLAVVMGAAAGYVAAGGQPVTAELVKRTDATTCVVEYVDPWQPDLVRTDVDCPRDLTARFEVLALPEPFHGDAINSAGARPALTVALTVLLAPAAIAIALRVRQRRL